MGRTRVARLSKSNNHIITTAGWSSGHMLVRKGQTQHRNRGRFCETTLDEHCTSTPSLAFSTSAVKGCSAITLNH